MELFEQIRRECEFGSGTIQGVARKLEVHRRMVREAVASATPARTVRQYVEQRKQSLGFGRRETFVPQSYDWGVEAVEVIRMGREFGQTKLEASVAQAIEWGSTDVAAIRHLLMTEQLQHGVRETVEIGEPGTGKSHLAIGLAIAACRQRKRVRFTTAAALVNQLVEAQREQNLTRMLARWSRIELIELIELIVIDELGYVPLAEVAAELLFQVIADRAEKAAIIVTTNLPFSEWPQVFTNARLCNAVLDRLTDQAHIIETGSESYRFRRTLGKKRKE